MRARALALLWVSAACANVQPVRPTGGECTDASCEADADEESSYLQSRRVIASSSAGPPKDIIATDLVALHDLLMLGYYGVQTLGPHLRDQAKGRIEFCMDNKGMDSVYQFECEAIADANNFSQPESSFPGLLQAQRAAVDLARLLPDVHPVESCRNSFHQNMVKCDDDNECNDEMLVEIQAAEAWACINITEDMIVPTCAGKDGCGPTDPEAFPLTRFRDKNGSLIQSTALLPYRNFVLKDAPPLGACQQEWTPGEWPEGKTVWLRACSFWASFHTMALRADALGGDKPNRLFGAIARIVSGGALWCGG